MKVKVEFEVEKMHCLYCPLREQTGWDNCLIQKDKDGFYESFGCWEEQMKNCPLKPSEDGK